MIGFLIQMALLGISCFLAFCCGGLFIYVGAVLAFITLCADSEDFDFFRKEEEIA